MTNADKLKEYIDKVLSYILGDTQQLKEKGVTVSFPYLFLGFAGIDFLGGLEYGFERGNSRKRSAWFISTWMSKVNSRYLSSNPEDTKSQASYLYNFARSGLIHMACVQQSVIVETDDSWRKYHLGYSHDGNSKVFIHPLLFAEEFEKAASMYLKDVYSDDAKVKRALNNLNSYSMASLQEESRFSLGQLFHDLASDKLLNAKTEATMSVKLDSGLGTQAPR
ncbi:MAG: hypothetical protein ABSF09_09220 [Candidatus Bathyarchaeia archaeon]|jgi:hypothetical protein